jgi:hypothetical protein
MFQNMKLGTKMFIGFAVVLVLLCGVGYFGFRGLTAVADRVEKQGDVSQMEKWLLEARRQEKNFILRGDDSYLAQVKDNVQKILDQAATTRPLQTKVPIRTRWSRYPGRPVICRFVQPVCGIVPPKCGSGTDGIERGRLWRAWSRCADQQKEPGGWGSSVWTPSA